MTAIRDEPANPRRSPIEFDPGDLDIEDLIDDEEIVVMMTASGCIKTVSADVPHAGSRWSRCRRHEVEGRRLRHRHHPLERARIPVVLLEQGSCVPAEAVPDPDDGADGSGTALVNLLQLQPDERIQAVIDTRDYETNRYLFFVTRNGVGKKTLFNA